MSLDFPESKVTASRYVREAIPMMVKNNIAPNPCNFALWYAYVSNRDFELKIALDDTISKQGTCPPTLSKDLFKKHVLREELELQQNLQDSLGNIMHELVKDVQLTSSSTHDLTRDLEQSLDVFAGVDDAQQIRQAAQQLLNSASASSKVLETFQDQLLTAELEITALRTKLEQKEQEAYLDPLTGVGNRRAFDQRLYQLCENNTGDATLVLIDLDHFKNLNDTHGHLLGDKVLQAVAEILKQVCPEDGLAARYGGEEFAFLIAADNDAGAKLAETMRTMLHKLSLRKKNSDQVIDKITASFGVATRVADEHPEQWIERADKALYAAKEAGRDRVEKAA